MKIPFAAIKVPTVFLTISLYDSITSIFTDSSSYVGTTCCFKLSLGITNDLSLSAPKIADVSTI